MKFKRASIVLTTAAAILAHSSLALSQQDHPPIIVDVNGSTHEVHWTVGVSNYSTPFSGTGDAFSWRVDESGHLISTHNSTLQGIGSVANGTVNSTIAVHHNYQFNRCVVCPLTGVDVTASSSFWVPAPPNSVVWIQRGATSQMVDISTPYIPNTYRQVTTSYNVGGPIPADLNGTSTSSSGSQPTVNYLHTGIWTAVTSNSTRQINGIQYSLALQVTEKVNVDANLPTGVNATGKIDSFVNIQSSTNVSPFPEDVLTCKDALEGSVKAEVVNGKGVKATFTPNYGLTLQQAAKVCDCQKFDWLQNFEPSSGANLYTVTGNFAQADPKLRVDGNGQLLAAPGFSVTAEGRGKHIDPILDGSTNMYVRTSQDASGRWRIGQSPTPWSDGLPYVDYAAPLACGVNSLCFEDFPTSEASAFRDETDFTKFSTQLVGVTGAASHKTFSGWNTNFSWKSNVAHDGGGETVVTDYYATAFGVAPPSIGGSVFDLQFDNVPEPCTLLLTLVGFITAALHQRKVV